MTPDRPTAEQASPPKRPFARQRAILIGVDQYERVQALKYCGKDVRDIGRAFRDSLEFDPADVLEFTVDGLLKPERNQIIHSLGEFLKRDIKPDELLLFYFSGHGMIDEAGQEEYLLPIDASPNDLGETGISVKAITKRLVGTGCKNIVMFIDACREALGGAKGLASVGEVSREALARDGIVTFFSCDPRERSYEIRELEHGSFTQCLLDAIQQGDCSTVEAIDRYLRENVPLINSKYNRPAQRPFTIIQPAEKAQLAIFYSEIKRQNTQGNYVRLQEKLGDVLANNDEFDSKSFTEAIELLQRFCSPCVLTAEDKRRLAFIEQVCTGVFTPRAFRIAWDALGRSRLKGPAKTLERRL